MARFGLVLFAILAALGLGLPWWGGLRAEETYERYREFVQLDLPPDILRHEYRRGWFRSEAVTVLGLVDDEAQPGAPGLRVEVRDEIVHGPFPLLEFLRGDAPPRPILGLVHSELRLLHGAPDGEGDFSGVAVLRADTLIPVGGEAEGRLTAPAFEHRVGETFAFAWEEIEGDFRFEPRVGRFAGSFQAPGFLLEMQEHRFAARDVASLFSYEETADGLPVGEASLAVAELELHAVDSDAVSRVDGFRLSHSQLVEGADANAALAARWERLEHEAETHGAGRVQLAVRGLDAETLARLVRTSREADALDDRAAAMTMKLALFQFVPILVERAGLEFDAVFDADPEPVEIRVRVSLDETAKGGFRLSFDALAVDVEARAPVAFLESRLAEALAARGLADPQGNAADSVERALGRLRERWLIVRDGDRYVTRMRFRGGELLVNGRAVDPGSLRSLGEPEPEARPEPSWAPAAPAR